MRQGDWLMTESINEIDREAGAAPLTGCKLISVLVLSVCRVVGPVRQKGKGGRANAGKGQGQREGQAVGSGGKQGDVPVIPFFVLSGPFLLY